MRIVDEAVQPPAKCLVTGDADGPFIDTERWANTTDPYIYLHVPLIEEIARDLLGMVPRSEIEELEKRLASYEEEVGRLRRFVDAQENLDKAAEELAA